MASAAVGRVALGTVVAKNYVAFARALARSLRAHCPGLSFYVLLVDELDGRFDPGVEPFEMLSLGDLVIPGRERLLFRLSLQQMLVTSKPRLLRHLLDGFDAVIYLDADVLVTGDLTPVIEAVRTGSVALTPHLLSPLSGPWQAERELAILRSGVYNAGFVGVSNTAAARDFLGWWQDRVDLYCRHDPPAGLHNDQRWLDLVPGFFPDVAIVRDPGCNVAYWNLPERRPVLRAEGPVVADQPIRFFHFSGFDPDTPDVMSRHANGLSREGVAAIRPLLEQYAALVRAEGHAETKNWPYAYGCFDNGVAVPDVAREVYAALGEEADAFGNPFSAAPQESYYRWLIASAEAGESRQAISRLWEGVYRRRPDVQRAFPDHLGADREAFREWARGFGAAEHGIPGPLLPEP